LGVHDTLSPTTTSPSMSANTHPTALSQDALALQAEVDVEHFMQSAQQGGRTAWKQRFMDRLSRGLPVLGSVGKATPSAGTVPPAPGPPGSSGVGGVGSAGGGGPGPGPGASGGASPAQVGTGGGGGPPAAVPPLTLGASSPGAGTASGVGVAPPLSPGNARVRGCAPARMCVCVGGGGSCNGCQPQPPLPLTPPPTPPYTDGPSHTH
jgi:hypothetical protein